MKVCLVGSSGGHLTHLYMLKPFWQDKERFWVVVLRPKKIVYPVSDKVKIVQFTDEGKLATIKRIKKLHRVMKESAAEVVIPFLPIISLYTLIANIGLRKKVIMSERADPRAQFKKASDHADVLSLIPMEFSGISYGIFLQNILCSIYRTVVPDLYLKGCLRIFLTVLLQKRVELLSDIFGSIIG